jgi:hypothetical protein
MKEYVNFKKIVLKQRRKGTSSFSVVKRYFKENYLSDEI